MKFFYDPIKGLNWPNPPPGVRLSQSFGNDPVASQDIWYGPILVKKGQHVYRVLANHDGHNGLDIAAPEGTPIYAPTDGWLVENAGKNSGFGIRVSLRHENQGKHFLTVYGHLQWLAIPAEFPYDWNRR